MLNYQIFISPTYPLFFLGPIIILIFSLLGYAVTPCGPVLNISYFNLGILYMLAVCSLYTFEMQGILRANLLGYLKLNPLKFLLSLIISFTFVIIILYLSFIERNSMYNLDYIHMVNEPEGKGTVEINNLSINGLDVAVDHIRDGAVYIGGMADAGKIVKNSSIPLGQN